MVIRQYNAIFNRLLTIAPSMARLIGGNARRRVESFNKYEKPSTLADQAVDEPYWTELRNMWMPSQQEIETKC